MSTSERVAPSLATGQTSSLARYRRLLVILPVAFVAVQTVGSGTHLLLAASLDRIQPMASVTIYGAITGFAALCALFAHPIAGFASDHTPVRLGRRSAWVAIGAVASTIGLLGLGHAGAVLSAGAAYVVAFAALPVIFVPLYATVPDRVPATARGLAGAVIGGATIVGGVAGNLLAARFVGDIGAGSTIFAILLLVGAGAFVLLAGEDRREASEPQPVGTQPVDVRRSSRDLAWFSLGRFGLFFGYAAATGLAYYVLRDNIRYAEPAAGVAAFALASGGATFLAAVVSGPWSDRLDRRKPFVVVAGALLAVGALLPAASATYAVFLLAGVVIGLAFGVYLAVGTAMATLVLPTAETSGRDIGLIGFSNAAAQAAAPIAGAFLAATLGYPVLFVVAAVASLASAVAVLPIRSVR